MYIILYYFTLIDLNFIFLILIYLLFSNYNIYKLLNITYIYIISLFYKFDKNISYTWLFNLDYGFNLLHPPLYYFCIITAMIKISGIFINNIRLINIISLLIITLFLGMCWGSINDSWSFFWSNDMIEYTLIAVLSIILYNIHNINYTLKMYEYIYILISIFILLLFLRFNIISSIHVFFINNNFTLITNYIYCYKYIFSFLYIPVLFLLIIYIILIIFSNYLVNYFSKLFNNIIIFVIHISLIPIILLIINFYNNISFISMYADKYICNLYETGLNSSIYYFYSNIINSVLIKRLNFLNLFNYQILNIINFSVLYFFALFYYLYIYLILSILKIYIN